MGTNRMKLNEIENTYAKHLKHSGFSKNTISSYANDVRKFIDFLNRIGVEYIDQLTSVRILDYFAMNSLKNSTMRRNISSVKSFIFFIKEKTGFNLISVFKDIKLQDSDKTERDILSVEEVEQIMNTFQDKNFLSVRNKAIFFTLYFTGMRASELCNLKYKSVNLDKNIIEIGDKTQRQFKISSLLAEVLREYVRERAHIIKKLHNYQLGCFFIDRNGSSLTRQSIFLIIRKYAKCAGIEKKISPQTLRNSISVHLLSNGADCEELKKMLGNKVILEDLISESVSYDVKSAYLSSHPILRDK